MAKEEILNIFNEQLLIIKPYSYIEFSKYCMVFIKKNKRAMDNIVLIDKDCRTIVPFDPRKIPIDEYKNAPKEVLF